MVHKKIRLPRDNAVEIMEELGKIEDSIQFVDLNEHDYEERKNFGNLIERCDEVLKNITTFENLVNEHDKKIIKYQKFEDYLVDLEKNKKRNG